MLSTLALLLSTAAATPAFLFTESSNSELDFKGLSNIHEGAGLNGVYVASSPVSYGYNETTDAIYAPNEGIPDEANLMRVSWETLIVGIAGDTLAKPLNGYLTVNGSADVFHACKPGVPYDPYHYSEGSYGIAVFSQGSDIPSTCEPIKIRALV